MAEPKWIHDESVLPIHQLQLSRFGGISGIRDPGLLASALARPRQLLAYGDPQPDLPDLAASYAFGIAKNHPFLDGNKRTALAVMLTFLFVNGFELKASDPELIEVFLDLAAGEMSEAALGQWIRERPTSAKQ